MSSSTSDMSASLDCGYFVDGSGYYAFDDVVISLTKYVIIISSVESSLLLLSPLYKSYDASKGVFDFNDEASFSFCTQEIADVIAMKDRGISLEECLSSSPHFPQYLYHLRDQCVTGVEGKILATHIKPMLNGMSIGDDEGNLLFKKLMIYYLIEEVLLCEANSTRVPRAKTWHLVQDIQRWLSKDWDKQGGVGEHSFEGAMPVLEMTTSVGNNSVFRSLHRETNNTRPNIMIVKAKEKGNNNYVDLTAHDAWYKGKGKVAVLHELSKTVEKNFHTRKQEEVDLSLYLVLSQQGFYQLRAELSICTAMGKDYEQRGSEKPKNKPHKAGRETTSPPKKDNPVKDAICHQCGEWALEKELSRYPNETMGYSFYSPSEDKVFVAPEMLSFLESKLQWID
ncbi:hypothetical protein Tco_1005526 [Tanacetum coccineum]|uniref:Uncharacterized protein n=1 Tax=Tanacetum coccineum TaxID=301880 RepID=A0ABQ5FFH0_9ASTR